MGGGGVGKVFKQFKWQEPCGQLTNRSQHCFDTKVSRSGFTGGYNMKPLVQTLEPKAISAKIVFPLRDGLNPKPYTLNPQFRA